jgi:hypothetical protein
MADITAFLKAGVDGQHGMERGVRQVSIPVDFTAANGNPGVVSAADTVQLWTIPAYTEILRMNVRVITGEGATATIDIGDSDAATTWFSNQSIQTATTATENATAKTYTAADALYITADHALDTAVIIIYFDIIDRTPVTTTAS